MSEGRMSIKFTIPNVPTAVDYTATSVSNNGATIPVINKPTLFSGAYTDLTGKPTLATVATSGAYTDLTSQPTIPSKLSQLNNDALAVTGTSTFNGTTTATNGLVVSGQAAATAQNFPTAAMTANTSAEGFVATASSVNTQTNVNQIYYAFDKTGTTRWACNGAAANLYGGGTTGANTYTGTTTTMVSGAAVAGEWIQLQTPVPYRLSSYIMTDANARQKQWTLAGSQDGITWYTIDSQNLQTVLTTPVTYSSFTQPGVYSYYRLIVQVVTASQVTDLTDLIFNGFPYAAGSLTVTGNVTATNVTASGTLAVTGSSISSLPVTAMTSNTSSDGFVITSNTSQSGAANVNAYQAFDRNTATAWIGAQNYFPQNGIYAASQTTTVGGTSIPGDYIQLQTPVPYRLTSYVMTDTAARQKQWTLAGSLDGTTWTLIDSQNLTTIPTSATTYTPAVTTGVFTYFRLIVQLTLGAVTNGTPTNIAELLFYGVPVLISSGQNGVIAQEITKTNALAATWASANASIAAASTVAFPGPWTLQTFSKIPSGVVLMNASNQLVFPYNGIYALTWVLRFATSTSENAIFFQPISGTYGTTGQRRIGSSDFGSGGVTPSSTFIGYFAANDVIQPWWYSQVANSTNNTTGDGYLSMVLIARTP
jgi:hypothetical protein